MYTDVYLLVIWAVQLKTSTEYFYTPLRMAKIEKNKYVKDMEQSVVM